MTPPPVLCLCCGLPVEVPLGADPCGCYPICGPCDPHHACGANPLRSTPCPIRPAAEEKRWAWMDANLADGVNPCGCVVKDEGVYPCTPHSRQTR